MTSSGDIRSLPLPIIIERCKEETAKYYNRLKHDPEYCFELFRRAFEDENQQAWSAIVVHYNPLIRSWIRRKAGDRFSIEDHDDVVNGALARFWVAVTRNGFTFDSLAKLLSYLALCVGAEVIDVGRKRDRDALQDADEFDVDAQSDDDPEETANARARAERCWAEIMKRAKNERERVYAELGWRLGYKPREIQALRPDLFPSVTDVNQTRANFAARLRRDDELRAMCDEMFDEPGDDEPDDGDSDGDGDDEGNDV
jgi:DNA-directed RNA polymerase specialized sigma24 family protein